MDSMISQPSACSAARQKHPKPGTCRPGKYANNQSSLGDTQRFVGGSYDPGALAIAAGDESRNCFDDGNARPTMAGSISWAKRMAILVQTTGLLEVSWDAGIAYSEKARPALLLYESVEIPPVGWQRWLRRGFIFCFAFER